MLTFEVRAGPSHLFRTGHVSCHPRTPPYRRQGYSYQARCYPERVRTSKHRLDSIRLGSPRRSLTPAMPDERRWWGPKVLACMLLTVAAFFIPNGFFMFYGNCERARACRACRRLTPPPLPTTRARADISLIGATIFILIGLVLLIDFAHTWSETCLERWEATDSPLWKWTLISSTLGLYLLSIILISLQYAFFSGKGCGLNTFFISANLVLGVGVSGLSIAPAVQESNPRSGLAQSGMVVAYTSYLVTSAIANHDDAGGEGRCNPLQERAAGARTGMVVLGAVFTFLAIAYSTSRAATQSKALVGRKARGGEGYERVGGGAGEELEVDEGGVTSQPKRRESLRYQALMAAVAEG